MRYKLKSKIHLNVLQYNLTRRDILNALTSCSYFLFVLSLVYCLDLTTVWISRLRAFVSHLKLRPQMDDDEDGVMSSVLFPDLSMFEVESEDEEIETEALSPWALSKIGTFQYRLEELIRYRELKRGKTVFVWQIATSVILRLANDVFGFNGWSSSLLECVTVEHDFDEENSEYSMKHHAHVEVKLQDGSISRAVGVGVSRKMPHKYMCLQYSKKMAVTNGLRNAILNFTDMTNKEVEVTTEVKLELEDWEG